MESKIKEEIIYKGKILTLTLDDVKLENKNLSKREVVHHNGGCCLALRDPADDKYFLVRQYRYAVKQEMIEFCAGKIENNEDRDAAIRREAIEELGYTITNLRYCGLIAPTCGYSTELIYLYTADAWQYVGTDFDEDEDIMIEKYDLNKICEMIDSGEIIDAKTIALVYHLLKEESSNVSE